MIDVHCHLEQPDYDKDRGEVIEKCRKELKAVITSCAHPKDFDLTMQLVEKYKGFVFATVGIHPEYVKEISEKEIDAYMETIKKNKDKIVGLGEIGLDFWHERESVGQEKQKKLFIRLISFAKEIHKPLTVHCRDAYLDCIKILEQEDAKNVHLHMWGEYKLFNQIVDNGWYVSAGPIIAYSKKYKKVARKMPIGQLMLETDSPWFGGKGLDGKLLRGEPTNIKIPAIEIAKIKKMEFKDVWEICGRNTIRLFSLPLRV